MTELLAAIIAAPDDDALRRVYADALLDEGDPQGELIHLQLDLAGGGLAPDERAARRNREGELLAAHATRWSAPIAAFVPKQEEYGPMIPTVRFRRGFIDEVILDAQTFAAHAEELFELAPLLRGVALQGMVDEDGRDWVLRKYREAMRSPVLSRLHGLRCEVGSYIVHGFDSQIYDEPMAEDLMPLFLDTIARMPHLRALAMFDPEDRLADLVAAGLFARLDRFDFTNFDLAPALAALDAFPEGRLRSVALPWYRMADVVAALSHPKLQGVEELAIKKPLFEDELDPLFDAVRALPALRRLELAEMRGQPVPPLGLDELALPSDMTVTVFGWS